MISTAEPRTIAGKIASAHNRRECRHCNRPLPAGGVLACGLSGSDARWYPDRQTAESQTTGVRYVFPVAEQDVSPDQVVAWLESQRDEIDRMIEWVEADREQRRVRRLEAADNHGFRTGPFPCADCGHLKHRPADCCERCGDEPTPLGTDPHAYNRGYGYRD